MTVSCSVVHVLNLDGVSPFAVEASNRLPGHSKWGQWPIPVGSVSKLDMCRRCESWFDERSDVMLD